MSKAVQILATFLLMCMGASVPSFALFAQTPGVFTEELTTLPPGAQYSSVNNSGSQAGSSTQFGAPAQIGQTPNGGYLDLDSYMQQYPPAAGMGEEWTWQVLPSSIIYKSYLAGIKESRFGSVQNYIKGDGWVWDATLGTRVGLIRFGDRDPQNPEGFQLDAEGSAQARLLVPADVDLQSVDFRGGAPITWGVGPHRLKFGYYHLSSHLGDEFLLKNPNYPRLNFARDVLILGYSYYFRESLRLYSEAGWAFYTDVSEPWEFQFGVDYAPARPTGFLGAPFFAVNGHIRQEVNYSGNLVAQAGWAWMSDENAKLLRVGVQYFNGKSNQFSFYEKTQQQLGMAVWYDF